MTTRAEILHRARELADAVADSEEIAELQRCEAALAELQGRDAESLADDPRATAYAAAKDRAERLIRQVSSAFLFPLTGSLQQGGRPGAACAGCERTA